MPFTIEQRSKIVKFYLETKSLVQIQREYRKHFGVKEAPSVTSIKKIVQKFEVHGTCHNRNKGNSGRRVSARTELKLILYVNRLCVAQKNQYGGVHLNLA